VLRVDLVWVLSRAWRSCALISLVALGSMSVASAQSKELSGIAKERDANGNGVLERDEAGGPVAANFDTIDTDKNGTLDGAEIRAFFQGGPAPAATTAQGDGTTQPAGPVGLSPQAKARDANGNGVLERDEAGGPVAANFDTIDTDKNGTLDGAELRSFFGGGSSGRPSGPPATVIVDAVVEENIGQTTPVVGRFVALQSGPVAARIGGPVLGMDVNVGDRVDEGALIAVLDKERLELDRVRFRAIVTQQNANLAGTRADLTKRQNELKRLEAIRKSAAFSQARYDDMVQDVAVQRGKVAETQAQLAQAEAQLKRAERDVTDAEIRAPFPGVVSATHTEVGAWLSVGNPVVTIINDTSLDIEADIPTGRLAGLTEGSRVGIRLDGGLSATAVLRAIIPDENPRTRTRPVRFTPNLSDIGKSLADNQSVTVLIPVGEARTAVTVSKDAIIERNGQMSVFVVRDGAAAPTPVTVGDGTGDRFIVRSGLNTGDTVVIRGNEDLRPGQRLIIIDRSKTATDDGAKE
jgi:RND family efflux transporter MFP subunit